MLGETSPRLDEKKPATISGWNRNEDNIVILYCDVGSLLNGRSDKSGKIPDADRLKRMACVSVS